MRERCEYASDGTVFSESADALEQGHGEYYAEGKGNIDEFMRESDV